MVKIKDNFTYKYINKKISVFDLEPNLSTVAEFEHLTPKQMNYVVLYADYRSPFRNLPEDRRKIAVAKRLGWDISKQGDRVLSPNSDITRHPTHIQEAIKMWRYLFPDEKMEDLMAVKKLREEIRAFISSGGKANAINMDKKVGLAKKLSELDDMIASMEEEMIPKELRSEGQLETYGDSKQAPSALEKKLLGSKNK